MTALGRLGVSTFAVVFALLGPVVGAVAAAPTSTTTTAVLAAHASRVDPIAGSRSGSSTYRARSSPRSTITDAYDKGNRLGGAVDSLTGTISDCYDDLDRLTQEQQPKGTVSYTYDAAGRRASMTVAGQPQVGYGWDDANRLTSVSQGGRGVQIGYDNANRRSSLTLPDGIAELYGYDNASRLTSIAYQQAATTLGALDYDYDAARDRDAVWGSYARTSLPAALSSASYDAANELTKWGATTASSDANGSVTADGLGGSYSWNNRGQLASLSGPAAASFTYDAFGRRLTKTVAGATTGFLYDGGNVVQELSGSTPTANLFTGLAADESFTRTDAAGERDLLTDASGSTVALADTGGAVQTSYTYEPYGKATATGTASTNSFKYTGRETDATGLLELRARYYQPSLQRFLSEDPAGLQGGLNVYAYTNNNPLNYTDPSGLDANKNLWLQAAILALFFVAPELDGALLAEEEIVAAEEGAAVGARAASVELTQPGETFVRVGAGPENLNWTFEGPGGTRAGTYAFPRETFEQIGPNPEKLKDLGDLPGAPPTVYRILEPPPGMPIQRGTVPGGEFGGTGGVPEVFFPEGF